MTRPILSDSQSIFGKVISLFEDFGKPLFSIGKTPISISSLISFIVILLFVYVISKLLRRILTKIYQKRHVEPGLQHALNRLLHYFIMAIGIYMAVDALGVSLSALAAVGGVLLVGIGFGLQDLAKDFISGVIILLERPIRKDDFIEIKGNKGFVKNIGLRSTVITTYDDIDILIPNGKLMEDVVTNKLYTENHYRISVSVAYGSNVDLVRDTLIRVAKENAEILEVPSPIVFFEQFDASSLSFRLLGWIGDAHKEPRVKSDLHFAIDKAFKEVNINMPFPQMDVYFKNGLQK